MLNLSKSTVGIAAAGAGLCFIGYCIYFDRKRRSDPLFKQKLRERRWKNKIDKKPTNTPFPDPKDAEAMQVFFMQEIQTGERLLAEGNIDEGCEHITNAVAVCGQPQQLLTILQQTLPSPVFQLVIKRLPQVSMQLSSATKCEAMLPSLSSSADLIPQSEIELE